MKLNRKFLVTENERRNILSMYGLLKEQSEQPRELTIFGQTFFGNGKWKQLSGEGINSLNNQLRQASIFLTENAGNVVYVKIIAGESKVTNYDTEETPKKPVQTGYLSEKRAETLKKYLTEYFQNLVNVGSISQMPIFEPSEIAIGQTNYIPNVDNPNDPKYVPERFVKVELKLQSPYQCIIGLTIEVYYDKNNLCGRPHICDKAVFDIKLNGVVVGEANLNNKRDGGNRTSGPITITDDLARRIIGNTSRDIVISTQCTIEEDCHSSAPRVKISKDTTILFDGCTPDIRSDRGERGEKVILILDNCGNPKQTGDMRNMDNTPEDTGDNSGIKQIRYYSTSSTGTLENYIDKLIKDGKAKKNSDGTLTALKPIDFYFNEKLTKVKKDETFKII
jgi:hypothetical protein